MRASKLLLEITIYYVVIGLVVFVALKICGRSFAAICRSAASSS